MSEIVTTTAGHVDIFDAETQERVRTILKAGTADNTRRAYQGDLSGTSGAGHALPWG